ncbi:coiled-coil domain-containing protein 134-like [Pseudomyrmex gracilis]|uniref:coiled-coil domain-containing protein 134-like n=1 Tax=Pseudomyrmex gracilis TaxID=219809 RepID=UPI00099539C1|nr:coiled-coil domain-containing protein 134-like [Pseudomyrmex gracilis]
MFCAKTRRPLRALVYVTAIVLMLTFVAHAQQKADEPVAGDPQKSGESKWKLDEELFKKLFAQKRKNHEEAIQTLLKVDKYERLYKMVTVLTEAIVEVIESSRNVIENASFVPGKTSFPEDTTVRDALSSILENTALFGDIILYLPDIMHRVLKTQQKWYTTIHWSLNFANQTRHLLNKSTITMIRLVEQELNITERDPNYFNPYRSAPHSSKREDTVKKKSTRKEKRKKGPHIAKIEL